MDVDPDLLCLQRASVEQTFFNRGFMNWKSHQQLGSFGEQTKGSWGNFYLSHKEREAYRCTGRFVGWCCYAVGLLELENTSPLRAAVVLSVLVCRVLMLQ